MMDLFSSTDPERRQPLFHQTAQALEWPRVLELVAAQAHSSMGAQRCWNLRLEDELDQARLRLKETEEMLGFEQDGTPFPSLSFPDGREVLSRAAKGATLDSTELRDLAITMSVGRAVHLFLAVRKETAPSLATAAAPLADLTRLMPMKDAVDRCIDSQGNIRESATPELRRMSQHAHDLKQTMRRRLEGILASKRYTDVLQERYFAQREGRYVIPLKAEMRTRIPGIVHDVSASGATVFLEPRELVELNNSIKVAELAVQREISRILQDLSGQVAAEAGSLATVMAALATLDGIAAKAAFSRRLNGRMVRLNTSGRIALYQARHPLLLIARDSPEAVIANDIVMDETVRVLVISGPNTGGKTVTLKLVGLYAFMVRSGLLPPCSGDSEMPLFEQIYADVGDTQDLAKDLSSFSAHMKQMIQMIRMVQQSGANLPREAVGPRALVLLDELATSTDPTEGTALAEALLKRLAALHAKVVVTTHYSGLKALAQATAGFMNASVQLDVPTLSPTYRLVLGLPGGSSALEIAERLGMDESIVLDARQRLRPEDRRLEQMLAELQDKQRQLNRDTDRATALRAEAERAAAEARDITHRLRSSERDEQRRIRKKLTDDLMRTRAELQSLVDSVKRDRTVMNVTEVKQRVADIAQQASRAMGPTETVPIEDLKVGAQVEIGRFGTAATLLEPAHGKRRVRVRVGETEMIVDVSGLIGLPAGPANRMRRQSPLRGTITVPQPVPSGDAGVVDVRGAREDEAVERVIAALDRAVLAGASSLCIIHGHGTGRLKSALRAYLKTSRYVMRFRPGQRTEGGDGVTIAELH
jgi:DNA mismatch repair protein MutS2